MEQRNDCFQYRGYSYTWEVRHFWLRPERNCNCSAKVCCSCLVSAVVAASNVCRCGKAGSAGFCRLYVERGACAENAGKFVCRDRSTNPNMNRIPIVTVNLFGAFGKIYGKTFVFPKVESDPPFQLSKSSWSPTVFWDPLTTFFLIESQKSEWCIRFRTSRLVGSIYQTRNNSFLNVCLMFKDWFLQFFH